MNKKLIIILLIVLLICFLIISIKKDYDKEYYERCCTITLYADNDATDDEINIIRNKLENIEGIKSVELYTKEDALQIIKDRFGENAYLLDGQDSSIFPVSFVLTLDKNNKKNGEKIKEKVMKEVSKIEGIDEIKTSDELTLINYITYKRYMLMEKLN